MNTQEPTPRTKVTLEHILSRVVRATYTVLPDTTTTVCQMQMVNGFTIMGTSACVDPANYNQALGEKYAFEDAVNKAWPLEGYLLAEEMSKRDVSGVAKATSRQPYSWNDVATHSQALSELGDAVHYRVTMKDYTVHTGQVARHPQAFTALHPTLESRIIADINKQIEVTN